MAQFLDFLPQGRHFHRQLTNYSTDRPLGRFASRSGVLFHSLHQP